MIDSRPSTLVARRPPALRSVWARGILAVQLAVFGLVPGYAQEGTPPGLPEPARPAPTTGVTLGDLLDKSAVERERRIVRVVEEALAAKDKAGAWRRLENKSLMRLSAADAALAALKKNLTIEDRQHNAELLRRAILEAEAVFDPVLDLSVKYNESDTHERTIVGTVARRQSFAPGVPGPAIIPPAPGGRPFTLADLESFVDLSTLPDGVKAEIERILGARLRGIIFDTKKLSSGVSQTTETKPIFASRNQPNGPTRTSTYDMALSQQLPWGPRFDVSVSTTDRDVFYDNQGHSFGASWASRLVFNLEVPLPGGRNFGPYSAFDTGIKLAHKLSERGFWDLKAAINSTLLNVDLAYLDLVQSLENLLVQIDNRQLVERQSKHSERLFGLGFATAYDKAQIEAKLAQSRGQEEGARNAFIAASDKLATLIEYSGQAVRDNVYLPASYPAWLEMPLEFDAGVVLVTAKEARPELQISRVDYESSEIVKENAAVDARPDVLLNASIESIQNGAVFGYKSWEGSIGAIGSPDTLNQSYGASYQYPWGNRAFKARLAQAEGGVNDSVLVKRSTHNDVVREVNDALSNIRAARERIKHAERNLEAARAAYNSIARRAETGTVNENELIINIETLLQAKLQKIAATIDNKRAESSLLAAQGVIAKHHAGATASNALERYRLSLLAEKGGLQYFLR